MAKQLSMSADAIRMRAKRAAQKAANAGETTMKQLAAQIETAVSSPSKAAKTANIIKVGHALVLYRDGTVKKDSIWGVAWIGKLLVKFYGRRGAMPRFRVENNDQLEAALGLFELKLQGLDVKKLQYTELNAEKQAELLGGDFASELAKAFHKTMAEGKVDQRAVG